MFKFCNWNESTFEIGWVENFFDLSTESFLYFSFLLYSFPQWATVATSKLDERIREYSVLLFVCFFFIFFCKSLLFSFVCLLNINSTNQSKNEKKIRYFQKIHLKEKLNVFRSIFSCIWNLKKKQKQMQ